MTGRDAIKFIALVEQSLREKDALPDEMGATLEMWTLSPVLLPVAELVARAWLEAAPESPAARDLLHSCLLAANRKLEAVEVEAGGAPPPLLSDSEEERRHVERLVREAEERLREGYDR